jgi:hypothetical protein
MEVIGATVLGSAASAIGDGIKHDKGVSTVKGKI